MFFDPLQITSIGSLYLFFYWPVTYVTLHRIRICIPIIEYSFSYSGRPSTLHALMINL